MILPVSPNFNNNNNTVSFGHYDVVENVAKEIGLTNSNPLKPIISKKAKELFSLLEISVASKFTKLRKAKNYSGEVPEFFTKGKNGTHAVLRPVYNGGDNFLIQVNDQKGFEKILVNRRNPEIFKYEKGIFTPAGTSSARTYNSAIEKNATINSRVNEIFEEYLSSMLGVNEPQSDKINKRIKVNL